MAKTFYVPVNGSSKKPIKFYAPVNGSSKKIVKAYGSVNNLSKLFYGERVRSIESTLYPTANVYNSGIVTVNNGSRSPVTKDNVGDCVVFGVKNGMGTGYGGNWMVTIGLALTQEAAIFTHPGITGETHTYVIDGVTYYLGGDSTNASYGGATDMSSPINVPIFQDIYLFEPNHYPTQATVEALIEMLGIRVNI